MSDNVRARELARIHVGAKQLRLDEAAYRALLERVAGVRSAADLDDTGRRKVLREMSRLGFKAQSRGGWVGKPKDLDARPMLKKVEALLADARRPWSYAHGLAKRMHKVNRVEWLNDHKLHGLVAALQADANRRRRKDDDQ